MKKQSVIFWEDIVSPHQSSFIRELSEIYSVTLVVQQQMYQERIKQGWTVPDLGKCKIIISPTDEYLKNLLFQNRGAIHVFDGITSIPLVKKAFKLALKLNVRIGFISEPYDWQGLRGFLRFLRSKYLKVKHNNVDFILAIGDRGRWWYERCGYPSEKIYDWAYFVEEPKDRLSHTSSNSKTIIFVGLLCESKGVKTLIEVFIKLNLPGVKLKIIGNGVLKNWVVDEVESNPKIDFLGSLSNENVKLELSKSDLLVLPSKQKDGWGAVVNEALMMGTPCVVSDYCGSSVLLNVDYLGERYNGDDSNALGKLITKHLFLSNERRKEKIKFWYQSSLSAKSAVEYFNSIISNVDNKKIQPQAPWLRK